MARALSKKRVRSSISGNVSMSSGGCIKTVPSIPRAYTVSYLKQWVHVMTTKNKRDVYPDWFTVDDILFETINYTYIVYHNVCVCVCVSEHNIIK